MSNTIEDASHKTCTHCGKQFEGDIFNGPHLMSTLKTQFKSEEPFKKLALGIECPHCGAVFCADCATSTENLCPKCGQRGLEKLVVWDNHSAMSAHAAKAHIAQHWLSIDDSGHAHTIDAEQELTTCPGCQTSVAVGVEFCPACGYEFATKESAKGPVYFTYPQPAEAYVPSGKTTLPALAVMVLGSAIIGPAIGLLLYPVHQVGATLLAGLLSWGQGKAIIGAAVLIAYIVFYILAASVAAALIGGLVSTIGKRFKNRSTSKAALISAFGGLLAFVIFFIAYSNSLGAEAFDSFEDLLKLGWNIVALTGIAALVANWDTGASRFCEHCEKPMTHRSLGAYAIKDEDRLMTNLQQRRFAVLRDLERTSSANNCAVDFWYCEACSANGYLDVTTHESRITVGTNGQKKASPSEQLVFSTQLEGAEVKDVIQIPPPPLPSSQQPTPTPA